MNKMRPFILFIILSLYVSCIHAEKSSVLVGTWELESYYDFASGTVEYNAHKEKGNVELTFRDDGKNGSFLGHTISNTLNGEYTLKGKDEIHIIGCGGTKKGEISKWSGKFCKAMYQSNTYEILDDRLAIFYNSEMTKMTFIKKKGSN